VTDQKVLVKQERKRPVRSAPPSVEAAWAWVGWFGLVLAVVGGADFALGWYPTSFGSPEWEFATVASTFSGLPLVTIGIAGMVGAGLALGRRWLLIGLSVVLLIMAVFILAMFALFLTDVPVALRAVDGPVQVGVVKAIVKTTVIALVFGAAYAAGGIAALRRARRTEGVTQ